MEELELIWAKVVEVVLVHMALETSQGVVAEIVLVEVVEAPSISCSDDLSSPDYMY